MTSLIVAISFTIRTIAGVFLSDCSIIPIVFGLSKQYTHQWDIRNVVLLITSLNQQHFPVRINPLKYSGFSDSLLATTQPAVPAPTMMKSNVMFLQASQPDESLGFNDGSNSSG
uniref:Putative secreted protein n=1 Tax=Panstrongylus lignarius TaxID=156445 RepID=A0A224XPZ3_9HEMI